MLRAQKNWWTTVNQRACSRGRGRSGQRRHADVDRTRRCGAVPGARVSRAHLDTGPARFRLPSRPRPLAGDPRKRRRIHRHRSASTSAATTEAAARQMPKYVQRPMASGGLASRPSLPILPLRARANRRAGWLPAQ
jgi:hypothetical protein